MSGIIVSEESTENCRKYSESSDSEYDPQYKPIISLPEVIVPLNEENEEELFKVRAKIYRFVTTEDPPEWKERGTGELKLLRHTSQHSVRLVMRRDKTLKVCANHFIVPYMELKASVGSDKAFVYTVLADFADEVAKQECLAVKFGSVENANLFKTKFEEAKHIVKTECKLYNGQSDSDEDSEDEGEKESEEKEEKDEKKEAEGDEATKEVSAKLSELSVTKEL